MICFRCEDTRWVCEAHPERPWEGPHARECGEAGMPCPRCNRADAGDAPMLPKGFEPEA